MTDTPQQNVSAAAVAQVMAAVLTRLDDIDGKVDDLVGTQIKAVLTELREMNGSLRGHSRKLAGLEAWRKGHELADSRLRSELNDLRGQIRKVGGVNAALALVGSVLVFVVERLKDLWRGGP